MFSESVDIVVLPQTRCLKNHLWQTATLKIHHESLCSVSIFSQSCYKQKTQCIAKYRTQLAHAFSTSSKELKVHPSHWRWWKFPKLSLSLAPGSSSFLVCTNFTFCLRPHGKLLLFHLFILFFSWYCSFPLLIQSPHNFSLEHNSRLSHYWY